MSVPCNSGCSVQQEISDTPCLQENKDPQTSCEPEFTFVTVKNEDKIHQCDENFKIEPVDISTEPYQSVKEEPSFEYDTENLEEYQQNPFAKNDVKIDIIKTEYSFTVDVKDEVPVAIHEEQKYEDIKYNSNIVSCNLDKNCTLGNSASAGNIPSAVSNGKEKSSMGEEECVKADLLEDKQRMKSHEYTAEKNLEVLYNKEKMPITYECSDCKKKFSTKGNLKVHVHSVHDKVKYNCEECHKLFSNAGHLKRHTNSVHKKIKKLECKECHKMFAQAGNLKAHNNIVHQGIKNFKCTECPKLFSNSTNLKIHINVTHKGVKNFQCNECGKLFSYSGHLSSHVNVVHRGIKKFECNYCHKLFTKSTHLKTHITAMHKIL